MKKPTKGQTLYKLITGNPARGKPSTLIPVVVAKVGRKYFYTCRAGMEHLSRAHHIQYDLENWIPVDGCGVKTRTLYTSVKQWEDEREAIRLRQDIRGLFRFGNPAYKQFTLAQLRRVVEVLGVR